MFSNYTSLLQQQDAKYSSQMHYNTRARKHITESKNKYISHYKFYYYDLNNYNIYIKKNIIHLVFRIPDLFRH